MFGFLRNKERIIASAKGKVVPIEEVPDQVFSQKIMGDGYAIIPQSKKVYAPCDCTVVTVFETKHALTIKTDAGAEIIIHVGLDTVKLKGEGFSVFVKDNDSVKAGELLLEFDKELIESAGYHSIISIVILNPEKLNNIEIEYGEINEKEKIGVLKY